MANKKLDLISRSALIAEYDRVHIGPPGGARKLIEDAPAVEASNWIPVTERLPEQDRNVLVIDRITGEVTTAHLNEFNSFVFRDGRGHGASHWMPLPEPPKRATQ